MKLFRKSGLPVELSAREAYDKDWKEYYDRAAGRAALDMLKLQRFLAFGERLLIKKHKSEIEVDMPKSAKAWQKLISSYEDTPILVARTVDGKQVVAILMDEQF